MVSNQVKVCSVEGCERPRRSGYKICRMHAHRKYRTGTIGPAVQLVSDKKPVSPGQRFGELTAVSIRAGGLWALACDCGGELITTGSNLNRGRAIKCGNNDAHYAPTYERAHHRVKAIRGVARDHRCVDCGGKAEHWSFNNNPEPSGFKDEDAKLYPFSMNPSDYDPRCVKCHSKFDNNQKLSQPAGASTVSKEKK